MKVSDILRVKGGTLYTISPDEPLSRAVETMAQFDIGSLAVMEHGEDYSRNPSGTGPYRFVEWLYEQPEVKQIGSPWALDGFGGRSFTDIVHQDHIHIAIENPRWGQAAVDTRR